MISAIFATDLRGNFGKNGTLPWAHNPADMAWFKEHTSGQVVIMGRATWDDPKMPKPLPGRLNCVVSSTLIKIPLVVTIPFAHLNEKIERIKGEFPEKKIFIIGGVKLLEGTIDMIDRIYWTQHKTIVENASRSIHTASFFKDFHIRSVTPGVDSSFNILHRIR